MKSSRENHQQLVFHRLHDQVLEVLLQLNQSLQSFVILMPAKKLPVFVIATIISDRI
jgi:hypothetical protein